MTTYIPFSPPADGPQQFSATLDGAQYTVVVSWLYWAQNWFVSLIDSTNNLVFFLPRIESPALATLSSLSWSAGTVTAVTEDAMAYPVGSVVNLTIYNALPSGFNGLRRCAVLNRTTFTYALATNPGQASAAGAFAQEAPITGGYFTSTLIWRPTTGNFEVSP